MVIGAAGSFAAISTLWARPSSGAFLMMEVSGLGGPILGVVLVPELFAAGVGSLIFVGLDAWTGFGTFSLAVPDIPPVGAPDGAEFLWAIEIGLAAAVLGTAIRRLALAAQADRRTAELLLTPVVGLAVGGLAIVFAEGSDRAPRGALLGAGRAAGADRGRRRAGPWARSLLLIVCKGLAYSASLEQLPRWPHLPRPCSSAQRAASRCRTFPACR